MTNLEYFLLISIGAFIAVTLLAILLLYISRMRNINSEKLINSYSPVIDNILFPMLAGTTSVDEIIESKDYRKYAAHKKFQQTLLQGLIKLHIIYSGDYNIASEEFYCKSGLIQVSLYKLNSSDWSTKCEGIRELSQMNIQEAFSDINKCIGQNNSTLTLEAIIGIIRLKGLEGLSILLDHTLPFNDWIQLNILYEVDNANHTTINNFAYFLYSKNESLVVFGLRLIARFNQLQNIELIREMMHSTASLRIKNQAKITLDELTYDGSYETAAI